MPPRAASSVSCVLASDELAALLGERRAEGPPSGQRRASWGRVTSAMPHGLDVFAKTAAAKKMLGINVKIRCWRTNAWRYSDRVTSVNEPWLLRKYRPCSIVGCPPMFKIESIAMTHVAKNKPR